MKKWFGRTAFAFIILFIVALPVQAYIIYFDATLSVADLMMILLMGPGLAVVAGFRQKMEKVQKQKGDCN